MSALVNDSLFLSSNGLLMDDIRFGARCFHQLRYSHVKREGNKVAHNLARYVSCILDFVMWMEDGSPHFLSFDQADIVVFSYYYAFFPLRKIINKKNLATYNI